mgnify:CR=1 FL=1
MTISELACEGEKVIATIADAHDLRMTLELDGGNTNRALSMMLRLQITAMNALLVLLAAHADDAPEPGGEQEERDG